MQLKPKELRAFWLHRRVEVIAEAAEDVEPSCANSNEQCAPERSERKKWQGKIV